MILFSSLLFVASISLLSCSLVVRNDEIDTSYVNVTLLSKTERDHDGFIL